MRIVLFACVLGLFVALVSSCTEGGCPTACRAGEQYCSGEGILRCEVKPETGCLGWVLRSCPSGQGCRQQTSGVVGCGAEQDCSQKYAEKRCVGRDIYWFDNCNRQRELVVTCPGHTSCVGRACQKGGGGCVSECQEFQTRCTSSGLKQSCLLQPNGCHAWGQPLGCPSGQVCKEGRCGQGTCANPCQNGQTRCAGDKVQACRQEASGCFDWGPVFTCPAGQSCQKGLCAVINCPTQCQNDSDCGVSGCGTRVSCQGGQCTTPSSSCNNQCAEGQTRCAGAQVQACRKEANGCTNWGTPYSCPAGATCQGNVCQAVQKQCPSSCVSAVDCPASICGTRTSCTNGVCSVPSQQCPTSCTVASQCAVPACGTKTDCVGGVCAVPSQQGGWKYGKNVAFQSFPTQNSNTGSGWGSVLTDIMQHEAPGDSNPYPELVTKGHETTHGINNYLRNTFNKTGKKANAFYVLQGRYIVLVEPPVTMADAIPHIPSRFQGSRYQLYLVQQRTSWNDRPLYIYDEWVSYVNGTAVGIDLAKNGLWTKSGQQDVAKGPLEFFVYGIAVAMAVEKKAPSFFSTNPQFLEFTAWLGAEAMKVHRAGVAFASFQGFDQATFLQELQTHADAKPMRDFCTRIFGQRWVDQVIFGKP